MQESSDLPKLNRSTRKPSISILLTIDDDGDDNQIQAVNLDEDEDSYEVKRKIGKRLIKKLVRTGDVDRKPNFYSSDESGCQKHMNSKYDELMAALNSIIDRAMQNDENRIVRRSTTPMSVIHDPDDEIVGVDHESGEERLYNYITSIQSELGKLIQNPDNPTPKPQPMMRRCGRQIDYDGLARRILKGIGLNTDNRNRNHYDRDSDEDDEMMRKYPIRILSGDEYTDDVVYDDMDVPDDVVEFVPTRNLTKRNSFWPRNGSKKMMKSLRKHIRFSSNPSDYCMNCRRRMRRSAESETTEADSTTDTINHGVVSDVESETETAASTTMESSVTTTIESSDNQSTLELSVTNSATELSIRSASAVPNDDNAGVDTETVTDTTTGILLTNTKKSI